LFIAYINANIALNIFFMKFRLTLIFLGALFSALNSFAQTDTGFLTRAVNALEKYSSVNPVEKVHLHLDKQGYMPGDTVWFKVYTVAGADHGLSAISGIVHVELLTEKDSIINRIALPLSSGVTWGDFALSALLKNGNYHIRAYTNWMRNFSADYFFDQPIRLSEPLTGVLQKKQRSNPNPDVQFFAEGGFLVNGLRTKVAIKAVGVNGLGENVDGSVIDGDGNEVSVFSCQHLGMGMFAITPQAGKSYKAKITRKDGKQFTVNLPKAQDDGFAIAVNNSRPDSLSIRVAASAKLFDAKKGARYYLLAQSGSKVYYTADFKLSAQSFTTLIDKKRFPTGIVQFTLFTDNGEPLNERIAFIRHDDQLKISLISAKETYNSRQKVTINIGANNKDGKPVLGSFSAAVINQDLVNYDQTTASSIFSDLLLTSDIKGYIEQPDYYFTDVTDKTNANLDLLMLTQGYHRFEWKNIIDKTLPALIYEPENSLSVSGNLKGFNGKPIPNGKIMLYSLKGGWFRLDTTAKQDGRFTFNGLIPDPDTTLKYVMQGRTVTDGKKLNVTLDTIAPFVNRTKVDLYYSMPDTLNQTAYQKQVRQQIKISLDKRVIPLKEVVIKDAAVRSANKRMGSKGTINIPEEVKGQTLSSYLYSKIVGVTFMNGTPYTYRGISTTPAGQAPAPAAIMQDGLPIDPVIFSMLTVDGIERVESYGGGINLISRKHFKYVKEATPDVITFTSIGFYKAKEFYTPQYNKVSKGASGPDLRTTVYWKPDIVTDKDGKATFSFFNADIKGTYRVLIEGIDIDGNLGQQVFTYKVE
jgi:hypothetical protein